MKKKTYKVIAKFEFEMVGTSANDVIGDLKVLMDSLVECHSNANTGCDDDYPENFTGKPPVALSLKATPKL